MPSVTDLPHRPFLPLLPLLPLLASVPSERHLPRRPVLPVLPLPANRGGRDSSLRRISGCSNRLTAISGNCLNRSWTI
jgi:hypothetical protein